MSFDLNEICGDEMWMENSNLEVDEVNLYQHFEEVHRENERVVDSVGSKESIFDFDLNKEAVDIESGEDQPGNTEVEADAAGDGDDADDDDDDDDDDHRVREPAVGDEFDSIDDAHSYYQLYGFQCGFSICKRSNHKIGNISTHYVFMCTKYPKRVVSNEGRIPKRKRGFVGTGCRACLKLKPSSLTGGWVVVEYVGCHNHILQPNSSFLISGFRYIPMKYQNMLDFNDDQGLGVAVNIKLVIKSAGGYIRCPFTKKDARNHIEKYKRMKLRAFEGDDASLIFEFFRNKSKIDRDFFYAHDYTNEGRLWSVFWADGRSRAAYKYFHDVIVMDATYLTNKYDMPLVLWVGVNHHGHSVILACALLGRETERDYIWCLSRFLECMNGVKPGGILTDQCGSIELGIKHVFGSETTHRYCSWHILHKLPSKLGRKDKKSALSAQVKEVVYYSQCKEDFEERWVQLMDKIGKQDDAWFRDIFQMREKWVPVYLNSQFWAGMNTTQRVESMNSFLDSYLTRRESLKGFVECFDESLRNIWEREHKADHDSKYRAHKCNSELPMEYQFQQSYTNEIFLKCQEQFTLCMNLSCNLIAEQDGEALYVVADCWGKNFQVVYKRALKEVFCICRLFEVMGVLCSHSIQVLKHEKVFSIDEKYIVDRWRKDIDRQNLTIIDSSHPTLPERNRLYELTMSTNPIIQDLLNIGSVNDEYHTMVLNGLHELRKNIAGLVGGQPNVNVIDTSGVSGMTPIVRKKKKSTTGKGKQQDVSAAGGETLLDGFQKSTTVAEQIDGTSLVNCPPSKPLLPPKKSNRRGRPKKIAYKSKMDVAIKKLLDKQKNMKKKEN